MSIAARLQSVVLDVNRPGNFIRDMWNRLQAVPGGRRLFSVMVGQAAPYTGSIAAQVEELRNGYCRASMTDRRKVRNHLNSVHAIALVNLAELTGNAAMAYSMPDDARFIVAGLSIEYVKKARGTIICECHCPVPRSSEKKTYEVPVVLRDKYGDEVARATLQTLIGPKPQR
ncbi:MAG TPA: DUF4442 domain-containing protein [Sorangium sp.]|nr:DUF4442 domain-containing protein [Sorangium sp.]